MRVQAVDSIDPSQRPVAIPQIDPVPRVSIQAFCETPETAAIVQTAIADRRMAKTHVKQNMGGAAAAVEAYRSAPTPNVVVLEATANRELLIEQLEELSNFCDAGTRVIVLGRVNDIVLYRDLMARGVSEYLVAPFTAVEFVQAVSNLFRAPGAKPLGRVVAVIGAKGGVGASTVAHNLSWALAGDLESPTIVADFDLGFGTAGLDYNQDPPQGVAEAVFAPERVDSNLIDRLLSKCGDRLHLLAAPATLDRVYDFSETSFDSVVDTMRAAAPWIVLDLPHAWTGWTRRMLIAADEVIVVAAPDLANLHAKAAGNRARRFRQDGRGGAVRRHSARPQAVRRGRQQWPDDRRNRAEGKSRRDVRRTRRQARRPRRSARRQARPVRSVSRQADGQERLTAAGRRASRRGR